MMKISIDGSGFYWKIERDKYTIEISSSYMTFKKKETGEEYLLEYPKPLSNLEDFISFFENNENILFELSKVLKKHRENNRDIYNGHLTFIINTIKKIVESGDTRLINVLDKTLERYKKIKEIKESLRNNFYNVFKLVNLSSYVYYYEKQIDNNKIYIMTNYPTFDYIITCLGEINCIKITQNPNAIYEIIFNNNLKILPKLKDLELKSLNEESRNSYITLMKSLTYDNEEERKKFLTALSVLLI